MSFKVILNFLNNFGFLGIAVNTNVDVYMTHPDDNKLTKISHTGGTSFSAATEITLSFYFINLKFKGDEYNGVFTLNYPTGLDLDRINNKLYIIN